MTFKEKVLKVYPEAFCKKEKCICQSIGVFYSYFIYIDKQSKYAYVGGQSASEAWKIAYKKMTTIKDMQRDKK